MTWTKWRQPKVVFRLDEGEEVDFTNLNNRRDLVSNEKISAVSDSFGGLFKKESNALVFRKFGFDADIPDGKDDLGEVQGIELFLHTTRVSRIQDKVIQLWYDGSPVRENKASLDSPDFAYYGGKDDNWKVDHRLTPEAIDFLSDDFGVLIDLQPHTEFPSANTAYIRKVAMRLWHVYG